MTAAALAAEVPPAHVIDTGSGPPLLCLHGWGASTDLFAPLIRDFSASRRLLVPDLPGFGETPEPPEPWDRDAYVGWILDLLDRLGIERADVVGHSFGGSLAIKLAAAHPLRVGKVVLTGSSGLRTPPTLMGRLRIRRFKLLRGIARQGWVPGTLRRAAQRRVDASGSRDYKAASGVMRPTFVKIVNEDLRPWLGRLQSPVLLVWGDRDDETPLADGREMEKLIPGAGLAVLEGGSHYAYLEQAPRFAKILRVFLDEIPPQ